MSSADSPPPVLLVASDVDGTLLDAQHKISPHTKDILFRVVVERHVPFIIATGRHHLSVRAARDDILAYVAERRALLCGPLYTQTAMATDVPTMKGGEEGVGFFLVSSNGARIHDDAGRLIAEHNLPADIVRALYTDYGLPYTHKKYTGPAGSPTSPLPNTPVTRNAVGELVPVSEAGELLPPEALVTGASEDGVGAIDNDEDPKDVVSTSAYTTDDWYITASFLTSESMMQKFGFVPRDIRFDTHDEANKGRSVFDDFPLEGVGKVCFRCSNTKILAYFENSIKTRFGSRVSIALSSNFCLDVMSSGVSKATALRDIAAKLTQERAASGQGEPISMANVIAFGDSMNDKDMLQMAQKGCVMANAQPRLKKELPQCEVIGHHNDDAVAKKLVEVFQLS